MPEGRVKGLLALAWAAALLAGKAGAQEPPTSGRFEVLPGLVDDKPPSVPAEGGAAEGGASSNHCADLGTKSDPSGLFLSAEYLLLKPQRRDLDFAILNQTNSGHPDGTTESLVLGTSSAFRVGGGYRLPNNWDVGASYNYLFSRGQRVVASGPNGTVYATLTHPEQVEQATTAIGDARLNYNIVDVEVGHRMQFADQFGLRVFGGGRGGFINQHVSATYNGRDAANDGVYSRVDFDGVGLRVGAEGVWTIGRGFSLFAHAAGSLVGGRYEVRETETNGTATLVHVSEKFEKVVPVTEYGVGLGWQKDNIRIRLGYEMTNWGNLVDRPDFVDDVHRGKMVRRLSDLSLDGLSFQVGIGF